MEKEQHDILDHNLAYTILNGAMILSFVFTVSLSFLCFFRFNGSFVHHKTK